LIEKKTGFGFFRLYEKKLRPLRKRGAHCEKFFTLAPNEKATHATIPNKHKEIPASKIIW
jgi:hypothetical protein